MKSILALASLALSIACYANESATVGYMSVDINNGSAIFAQPFGGDTTALKNTLEGFLDMANEGDVVAWPGFQASVAKLENGLHWIDRDGTIVDDTELPVGDFSAIYYSRANGEPVRLTIAGEVSKEEMLKHEGSIDFSNHQSEAKPTPSASDKSNVMIVHGSTIITITHRGKPKTQPIATLLSSAREGDTIAWPNPGFQATAKILDGRLHWVDRDNRVVDGEKLPYGGDRAIMVCRPSFDSTSMSFKGIVFVSPR